MSDIPTTFGIPDTLPPRGRGDLWGPLWLGGTGGLFLLGGLFPALATSRWFGVLLVACWLVLPAWALVRRAPATHSKRGSTQTTLYAFVVVTVGVGYTLWARQLGLGWPVVLGTLLLIEGLASAIASLTEWWRFSMSGHALGLMACGFGIPFMEGSEILQLIGAAVVGGNLVSAALYSTGSYSTMKLIPAWGAPPPLSRGRESAALAVACMRDSFAALEPPR